MNRIYQSYRETNQRIEATGVNIKRMKKLRGALFAETVRQELLSELQRLGHTEYTVSLQNSYVLGSHYEIDLMIVRADAVPLSGMVYLPEDVVAIIEVKAGGLFNVDKDTDKIAASFNETFNVCQKPIKAAYITRRESEPLTGAFQHWSTTCQQLKKKYQGGEMMFYASYLEHNKSKKTPQRTYATDEEFTTLVKFLIS